MKNSITLEQTRAKERELDGKLAELVKQFVRDTGLEPSISFNWRARRLIFTDERTAILAGVNVRSNVDDRASAEGGV